MYVHAPETLQPPELPEFGASKVNALLHQQLQDQRRTPSVLSRSRLYLFSLRTLQVSFPLASFELPLTSTPRGGKKTGSARKPARNGEATENDERYGQYLLGGSFHGRRPRGVSA